MCFPFGRPYKRYILKDTPVKKEPQKYVAVDNRTIWYPAENAHEAPIIHLPHQVTYTYPTPLASTHQRNCHCYCAHHHYNPYHSDEPSTLWYGSSKQEVDMQNRDIFDKQDQVVPYTAAPDDHQIWCKELDGSFTLRTMKEITSDDLKCGHWQLSKDKNYYWVRDPK